MRSIVERRTFRLGVLVLAATAMNLSVAMTMPGGELALWLWIINAAAAAVGIGLLVHARVARAVAGLVVAVGGVATVVSLWTTLGAVIDGPGPDGWTLFALLSVANSVVTAALSVWLCVRAIQALLGRQWAASLVTARLTGATLGVIAADHLWFTAAQPELGLGAPGGLAISVSAGGARLAGFPGWPIWHLALAILALMMLAGRRRMVARATTLLVVLCACLAVLVAIAAPRLGVQIAPFTVLPALVFTYLAWWLRDEVHRQTRDLAMTAVSPS